ncbi:ketopantoate reductase family protein [Mycobacterium sp. NPDC048908]|uniref:ketopantoate reductase family protein n=1 Tax=Mycobacterium sp. NPDC048908 TaxID=3364292 RepID=UPI00371196B2
MTVLVVGAGAGGGYIGDRLIAAGRDVTFLVHPHTLARLRESGLRLRHDNDVRTVDVNAVTSADLNGTYDVIVVAVRASAVASAIDDVLPAVGPGTRIVPIVNGIGHLSLLAAAFGRRALGAAARLHASLAADGVIDVVTPGIDIQLGALDVDDADGLGRTRAELEVPDIAVAAREDILGAMWEKFAFIMSTAVLTCLAGAEIGPIARTDGGVGLARRVLTEVSSIAAAEGHPLTDEARNGLDAVLTNPSSMFGPSMFRDLRAGRPIEIGVFADLADHARTHDLDTPLLDAAMVVVDVHNRRVSQ